MYEKANVSLQCIIRIEEEDVSLKFRQSESLMEEDCNCQIENLNERQIKD